MTARNVGCIALPHVQALPVDAPAALIPWTQSLNSRSAALALLAGWHNAPSQSRATSSDPHQHNLTTTRRNHRTKHTHLARTRRILAAMLAAATIAAVPSTALAQGEHENGGEVCMYDGKAYSEGSQLRPNDGRWYVSVEFLNGKLAWRPLI